MKKTLPIIAIVSSALVIGAGAFALANNRLSLLQADDDIIENSITLTTSHITKATNPTGPDTYGFYGAYVNLSRPSSTKSGQAFGPENDSNYMYGGKSASAGNGHILAAEYNPGNGYADVYFGFVFDFSKVKTFLYDVTVTFTGKFYYEVHMTSYDTEITYGYSDLSGAYTLNVYEGNLYKAEIDSITIEYTCVF